MGMGRGLWSLRFVVVIVVVVLVRIMMMVGDDDGVGDDGKKGGVAWGKLMWWGEEEDDVVMGFQEGLELGCRMELETVEERAVRVWERVELLRLQRELSRVSECLFKVRVSDCVVS